jgi:Zn-dependent peptidase ImmA (M78 family)
MKIANPAAKAKARLLLDKYFIEGPAELNLERLANAENLIIEEAELNNYLGMINFGSGYGIIKISKDIREYGQKQFVIAHEMGHFYTQNCNHKHCNSNDLLAYKADNGYENDANQFAAELLMREEWFTDFTTGRRFNLELLKDISEYFKVSMTAAAIRYAESGITPIAIILSKDAFVYASIINTNFPFQFVPKGFKVNEFSNAYDFYHGREMSEEPDEILADAWFTEDFKYEPGKLLIEQNLAMPRYNSVLTIVYEK